MTGHVQCDGDIRGEAVLASASRVVAVATLAADGSFKIAPPDGAATSGPPLTLIARLYEPVVGLLVAGQDSPESLVVDEHNAVELSVELELPDGVDFDWVDIKLTPRDESVPPVIVLAEGVQPGLREAFFIQRVTQLRTTIRVLRGRYDLRVNRLEDGGLMAHGGPTNLGVASVRRSDDGPTTERFGGYELDIDASLTVTVVLRELQREEL